MNQNLKPVTVNTLTLALLINQQVHENIKFADTKAAFFFTLNGGLIALLYAIKPLSQGITTKFLVFCQLAVCLVLAAGSALTVFVIWPRGRRSRKRGKGFIDAERIYQFHSADLFHSECCAVSDEKALLQANHFLYDRAEINRRKYLWLRRAIAVSSVGWAAALLIAAFTKFIQAWGDL